MIPGTKIACPACRSFIDPDLVVPCNGDGTHPLRNHTRRLALFQYGNFKLHSGARSRWKIECDVLTREDWETLAEMAVKRLPAFDSVWSCGGASERFALALRAHLAPHGTTGAVPLIVDDVLTTGGAMEDMRRALTAIGGAPQPVGLVAFARDKPPAWVTVLFQYMGED